MFGVPGGNGEHRDEVEQEGNQLVFGTSRNIKKRVKII